MPIRYMGTKRHIAHRVRAIIDSLDPAGAVVDLFSGMGSVAEALASRWPVTTNDLLAFTTVISRARFASPEPSRPTERISETLRDDYRAQARMLRRHYGHQIASETVALEGDKHRLAAYMADANHAGNSPSRARAARNASAAKEAKRRYRLALLYFSGGYFSAAQAIQIDAIRAAIDANLTGHEWDRAIAAWLATVSSVVNAPGHTAQYLKPNSDEAALRIQRAWRRDVWGCFQNRLIDLAPVGSAAWRRSNRVSNIEALEFLRSPSARGIGAVYADPPYTKDQYSRYYHLYETLYRYDFPESRGAGRYRDDRYSTAFSTQKGVESTFRTLTSLVAKLGVPLILSYPSNGLLQRAGGDLRSILGESFSDIVVTSVAAEHSTLGAASGLSTKSATENIYVCRN